MMISNIRQNERERKLNIQRLKGFDPNYCQAYKTICDLFGPRPSQTELLSLAQVVAQHKNIYLDREAMRRKRVLIKWFEENFDVIEPFLRSNVYIVDSNGEIIGHDPRCSEN